MRRAVLLFALAACGDNAPERCGDGTHVTVCDGALRTPDGRTLILRGVNFAGAHKMAPYTDPFGPADFARLRSWGFNSIRFVMPWAAVEPARGAYNDLYLDTVAERMQWATDAGISVVIDMHQDVYGEGFGFDGAPRWTCDESHYANFMPVEPWALNYGDPEVIACFDHLWTDDDLQADFTKMWRHVAERLKGFDAVIGFDPINEPYWGSSGITTFERDTLQPFYERVIAEVRKTAPHWIAFAEPSGSRNLGIATSLRPFEATNIVYAPHLYDTMAETSGGFDAAHRDALIANAMDYRTEADRLGAALWIGEYGGQGTDPKIGDYMSAAYDGAAGAMAGMEYWAYGKDGGYDVLDKDGNEVGPLVDAIARPAPVRVAGDIDSWAFDPAAKVFTMTWHGSGESVVVAPLRGYPNGFTAICDACSDVVIDGANVTLTSAGAATVTLSPR